MKVGLRWGQPPAPQLPGRAQAPVRWALVPSVRRPPGPCPRRRILNHFRRPAGRVFKDQTLRPIRQTQPLPEELIDLGFVMGSDLGTSLSQAYARHHGALVVGNCGRIPVHLDTWFRQQGLRDLPLMILLRWVSRSGGVPDIWLTFSIQPGCRLEIAKMGCLLGAIDHQSRSVHAEITQLVNKKYFRNDLRYSGGTGQDAAIDCWS